MAFKSGFDTVLNAGGIWHVRISLQLCQRHNWKCWAGGLEYFERRKYASYPKAMVVVVVVVVIVVSSGGCCGSDVVNR